MNKAIICFILFCPFIVLAQIKSEKILADTFSLRNISADPGGRIFGLYRKAMVLWEKKKTSIRQDHVDEIFLYMHHAPGYAEQKSFYWVVTLDKDSIKYTKYSWDRGSGRSWTSVTGVYSKNDSTFFAVVNQLNLLKSGFFWQCDAKNQEKPNGSPITSELVFIVRRNSKDVFALLSINERRFDESIAIYPSRDVQYFYNYIAAFLD